MTADVLETKLEARRKQSLWRERQAKGPAPAPYADLHGQRLINFASNDYLGLSQHPAVIDAAGTALKRYGAGSGAAALVTGYTDVHAELEAALADFCGRPRSLVFPAGYLANLGMLVALAGPGDHVFEDRLNHASLLDAAMLARTRLQRYAHCDPADLQQRLARSTATRKLVVTEGVFSMDGDIAPLPELAKLCGLYGALLCVDDAHGFGVLGVDGRGSEEYHSLGSQEVPLLVATFGKALGCSGAFVAGDEKHIEMLVQYARTYIYTTSLPPAVAAGALRALRIMAEEPQRRAHLRELIAHFRAFAAELDLEFPASQTPIQPFVIGSAEGALAASEQLREAGFWVSAMRPPTVPEGGARLRITLSAAHRKTQIEALLETLGAIIKRRPASARGER